MTLSSYLRTSAEALTLTAEHAMDKTMETAITLIATALRTHKPVLICGNGGSMADALHLAGELVARFKAERKGLPVIVLGSNIATLTAWSNDYTYATAFCREVEAFGVNGSVLIALSTSGNSDNIVLAAEKARQQGLSVIAFTGAGGGKLKPLADVLLAVPSQDTPLIQQIHEALYHYLCEQVEKSCMSPAS